MKRSKASTLLTIVFFAAVAVYIFYQVTANLTRQIRTVDALEVTVEDKISARGYFIRQQKVVSGTGAGSSIVLKQYSVLYVCRKEVGKRKQRKNYHCYHIG